MNDIFVSLSTMLYASWPFLLVSSFLWGIASILLSPCHLATLPLVIGAVLNKNAGTKRYVVLFLIKFCLGLGFATAVIGGITIALGRIAGDTGSFIIWITAILFILIGVYLLGLIPDRIANANFLVKIINNKSTPFMLGVGFSLGLGPCTFAFLAPVLGISMNLINTQPVIAVMALLLYFIGMSLIIIVAGMSIDFVQKVLNWNEQKKAPVVIKKTCGLLLITAAIYMLLKQYL